MHHVETPILEATLVLLVAALAVVPMAQRLKLSPVLGYLAAGMLIGPHMLGFVADDGAITVLAEFGIAFLLFTLGLELSIQRLMSMRLHIFGLGASQVLLTAGLFFLGGWLIGLPAEAALVIGLAVALSSTAVVLQVLKERGELVSRTGRACFSVLLFQDLAVAPILVLIPLLAAGQESVAQALGDAALRGLVAVVLIALAGRFLLRPFLRHIAVGANRELFAALAIVLALGTGWATQEAGLSMALGAFLAGLLLAETEYRHQIEADIDPFRGLLLGLFFMTVGMSVDIRAALEQWLLVISGVALVISIKALVLIPLARLFGLKGGLAFRVGLTMAQSGEFAFVVLGLAMTTGVLPGDIGQLLILVSAVSIALTPWLIEGGSQLAKMHDKRQDRAAESDHLSHEADELTDHVILAGFGRNGETVASMLRAREIPFIALDIRPERVAEARAAGWPIYYGDTSSPHLLRKANVAHARAVVITINQTHVASRLVSILRHEHPDLYIVVRARDLAHAAELEKAGADHVVLEILEASLQTGRVVLESLGAPADELALSLDKARRLYGRPGPEGGAGKPVIPAE